MVRLVPVLLALLLGLTLATGVQAVTAQAASKSTKVKSLISKIIKSKNPKKTYNGLSKANKALLLKELKGGKKTLRVVGTPVSPLGVTPNAGATGTCWNKSLEARYWGGVTKKLLFTTTQTTTVCVIDGNVSQVTVPQRFQDVYGLGWHPDGVSRATLDVDWEGRGVARGEFKWGAGGWYLFHGSVCSQLRLNRDFIHYAGSLACSMQA